MQTDKLQRRQQRIVDALASKSGKRLTCQEIAKITGLATKTVANEMPTVLNLVTTVHRSMRTGQYRYWVGSPETHGMPKGFEDWAKPGTARELAPVVTRVIKSDWQPPTVKLGWKLPYALSCTIKASHLAEARTALEELLEATTAYAVTLSRVLSTQQLWEDPASYWGEIPEDLAKTTSEVLERYAKLVTQEEPTTEGL